MERPKTISNGQAAELEYWLDAKYKIVFELAAESGLRISDLLNLKIGDIRKNPMTVYETKSKRKRTFKISDDLFRRLDRFRDGFPDSLYVFHSARGASKHIHRSTIHRAIKKALLYCNFDASAHSARKLYAANVFDETQDLKKVQKALHHQKLSTTLTYLDIPPQTEPQTLAEQPPPHQSLLQKFKNLIKIIFRSKKSCQKNLKKSNDGAKL